jgi:hypothetical protein
MYTVELTKTALIAVRMALNTRISYVAERIREDDHAMWRLELAEARDALAQLENAVPVEG